MRGLRQAAGAESPYALSERSRNRNGFSPAKAEARLAHETNSKRSQKACQRSPCSVNRTGQVNSLGNILLMTKESRFC